MKVVLQQMYRDLKNHGRQHKIKSIHLRQKVGQIKCFVIATNNSVGIKISSSFSSHKLILSYLHHCNPVVDLQTYVSDILYNILFCCTQYGRGCHDDCGGYQEKVLDTY